MSAEILDCVMEFYALEAISVLKKTEPFRHSHERWNEDFINYRNKFIKNLADAIFDYTTMVCAGEMRHGKTRSTAYHEHIEQGGSRSAIYYNIKEYEPLSILKSCLVGFNSFDWDSAFGGKKWAVIARAGLLRKTLGDVGFIDHCVDLSHNGSIYFNKHDAHIFVINSANEYKHFLDVKRIESPERLLRIHTIISKYLFELIKRAITLGIMSTNVLNKKIGFFKMESFKYIMNYTPIKWEEKLLPLKFINSAYGDLIDESKFIFTLNMKDIWEDENDEWEGENDEENKYEYKFNIGDIVYIKNDFIAKPGGMTINASMKQYENKKATICYHSNGIYKIKIDNKIIPYYWSEEMLSKFPSLKYKVGDYVKLKNVLNGSAKVVNEILKYAGKTVKIIKTIGYGYKIDIDDGSWNWFDNDIEKKISSAKEIKAITNVDMLYNEMINTKTTNNNLTTESLTKETLEKAINMFVGQSEIASSNYEEGVKIHEQIKQKETVEKKKSKKSVKDYHYKFITGDWEPI